MYTTFEALGRDTVVIWVNGDLDAFSAPDLKRQVFAALDSGFRRIVLEMSECGIVDSTGLGVLVAGVRRAHGRDVVLAAPSPELRHVLGVLGLDRVLPLYATRYEALERAV
jgi:anti-sigma B factor antagonist